ncbi:MAG: c-type cytochrome [Bradymonadaceae bacterium]
MNNLASVLGAMILTVSFFFAACSGSDAEFKSFEAELEVNHDAGESFDSSEGSDDVDVQAAVVITEEELLVALDDERAVAAGKEAFNAFNSCASCHGINGSGGFGPALDDAEWIHGAKPMEIYKVIRDGVPTQGMPGHGHLDREILVGLTVYISSL